MKYKKLNVIRTAKTKEQEDRLVADGFTKVEKPKPKAKPKPKKTKKKK